MNRPAYSPPQMRSPEYNLGHGQVRDLHRSFLLVLKENARGRFLRITEKTREYTFGISIPASGLETFLKVFDDLARVANEPLSSAVTPAAAAGESTIQAEELQVENRSFRFMVDEYAHGRFLRIVETSSGRPGGLNIPAGGLPAFQEVLVRLVRVAHEAPLIFPPAPPVPARLAANENVIKSVVVPIERKSFMLALRENHRGRYLRITEKGTECFACFIVAAEGLAQFKELVDEMTTTANQVPYPFSPPNPDRPWATEQTIDSGQMQVQNRIIVFLLQENQMGRYLRLVEGEPGHQTNSLIVPASGLDVFRQLVDDMVKTSNEQPLENLPP